MRIGCTAWLNALRDCSVVCGLGTKNVYVVIVENNIIQMYVVALADASRKTKSTIQQKDLWLVF